MVGTGVNLENTGFTGNPVSTIFSPGSPLPIIASRVAGSVTSQRSQRARSQAALISMESVTTTNTGVFAPDAAKIRVRKYGYSGKVLTTASGWNSAIRPASAASANRRGGKFCLLRSQRSVPR